MLEAIGVVAPVFALIAVGYSMGARNWIGPASAKGLAEFTFMLAVPAMLFRTLATTALPATDALAVWASYFGALFATALIAIAATALVLRRPAADGASIAMSAAYGNVVMLGIPLAAAAIGPAAAVPIAIILSLNTPVLWLAGSLYMVIVSSDNRESPQAIVGTVLADLARNPIVVSVAAGAAWRLGGLGLHPVADKVLAMLAQASVPCALVALGLSLAKFQIKGQAPTMAVINLLKLVIMPALAAVLAIGVFRLDAASAGVVILFSAMPTGANAYLFAEKYGRAMHSASGSVALGTAMTAITAAIIIQLLRS